MTDYAVTGKKGAGKGLFCAGVIRDALREGRRVATNMDIFLEHMLPPHNRRTLFRLPDSPTVADFEAIGIGNELIDESKNGIIVLDESSKFFNSRTWGDKERQPLLDWLIHSRKLGWDVYYQMQGLEQVDKQLRTTQVEYHIAVKRTDKWPIPFITPIFKTLLGWDIRFPRFHVGIVRHGCDQHALLVDRKWYKGDQLYQSYDTRQVFLDRSHPKAVGLHSVLSPWHVKGRYMKKWDLYRPIFFAGITSGVAFGVIIGAIAGYKFFAVKKDDGLSMEFEKTVSVKGVARTDSGFHLFLSDGQTVFSKEEKRDSKGHFYKVGEKWIKGE